MNAYVILIVFGVIFVAELPDKSQLASLALSTRFRKLAVWLGAAVAFSIHVGIAVTAGKALTLLPHRLVEIIVGLLFLAGAMLLVFSNVGGDSTGQQKKPTTRSRKDGDFAKAFTTSFVVIFLGEWGDITQVATANYAAKYQDPISVAIGALAALWCVSALSVTVGSQLLHRIRAKTLRGAIAIVMIISALFSFANAFK